MRARAIKKNKPYSENIPQAINDYIKKRFKCSKYLAKQITNELIKESEEKSSNKCTFDSTNNCSH